MANPLDMVTEDQRDDPTLSPVQRLYVSSNRNPEGEGPILSGDNGLTRSVAPLGGDDLMAGLAKLAEYIKSIPVGEGQNLLGPSAEGKPRYQLWPERMVRSGASLPHDVMTGEQPVVDPETGRTAGGVIERSMDTAGLAGGSTLFAKPGSATLGSGPVRAGKEMKPSLVPAIKWEGRVYKEEPGVNHVDMVPPKLQKFMDKNGIEQVHDIPENTPGFGIGFVNHKGHFLSRDGDAAAYAAQYPELIIPEARDLVKQGAMSSDFLAFSDTSKPGAAIAGAAGPAPVFYSALEHAATNAAQDVMSPQQWLGFLKNQPGVKAEELAWTGLGDWLGKQKGKVSKEDVKSYLDEHKVEIKDVTKEGTKSYEDLTPDELDRVKQDYKETNGIEPGESIVWDDVREFYDDTHAGSEDGTKYSSYQLPGGENYREHLLTMPDKTKELLQAKYETVAKAQDKLETKLIKQFKKDNGIEAGSPVTVDQNTALNRFLTNHPELSRLKSEAMDLAKQTHVDTMGYRSSHWDEPNVLAHVRTNDRVMPHDGFVVYNKKSGNRSQPFDTKAEAEAYQAALPETIRGATEVTPAGKSAAKKSLHIEEIQSDWHQQGRKQGYATSDPALKQKAEQARKDYQGILPEVHKMIEDNGNFGHRDMPDAMRKMRDQGPDVAFPDATPEQKALAWKAYDAFNDANNLAKQVKGGVPDAPFKTTWPELALKRMIRHAAENGYDRISWTPGEAQAARYDLSKQIDSVRARMTPSGNYMVEYVPKGGQHYTSMGNIKEAFPPEKLPDLVGKDLAEKIVNEVKDQKFQEYKGVDLKVGGEGMREFYDKMLPKMAEKIGKSHGVKVKTIELPLLDDAGGGIKRRVKQPVHYFDLPQSLKDHAIGKGFPLYMSGIPFPLTPVDHDPFKKDK